MSFAFDKDAFIRDAIKAGYLRVFENGDIWRATSIKFEADRSVTIGKVFKQVKYQVHKKSGRVYFNLTWRPHPGATRTITKSVLVNRVVALRFIPNPLNLPQVNHIDGNKENNAWKMPDGTLQLEWSSGRDNEKHAHANGLKTGRGSQNANAKLTATQVLEIRERGTKESVDRLVLDYGVSKTTIVSILTRKTWTHL